MTCEPHSEVTIVSFPGCIMVLGASFEFDKFHNKDIVERPSDNEEVPQVRASCVTMFCWQISRALSGPIRSLC